MADQIPVDTATPKRLYSCSQDREYLSIWNDATGTLYALVDGGQSPSPTNYSVKIAANAYYEAPQPLKRGQEVWGVWSAGSTGFASVQGWAPEK